MGFERTAFRFVVGVHTDDVTLDASIVFFGGKSFDNNPFYWDLAF